MRVLITGSTGLVGSVLVPFLSAKGHQVVRMVRSATGREQEVAWDPANNQIDAGRLEGLDGVVHLAGENIAARRWNEEQKARIRDSRVQVTLLLSQTLARLERPPRVLVSASAIGYYGDRADSWSNRDKRQRQRLLSGGLSGMGRGGGRRRRKLASASCILVSASFSVPTEGHWPRC